MISDDDLMSVFISALGIAEDSAFDSLEYNSIDEWDSIGHMRLVSAIETKYDIMLDTDDVLGMSTFKIAQEIVEKHVG
jgi:acyl carrier protein